MKRALALIAITAISIAALAGCASAGNSPGAVVTPASGPAPAAAPSSPSCNSQAVSWRNNGGQTQVNAISSDLTAVHTAAEALAADMEAGNGLSSDESALQSASASLQSDAQAAEANLPPLCIPGFRSAYGQALTDYSKASEDWQDGVGELSSGSEAVALGDIAAGTTASDAGNVKLQAADTDITAFDNS
jgi:hypothetical protein